MDRADVVLRKQAVIAKATDEVLTKLKAWTMEPSSLDRATELIQTFQKYERVAGPVCVPDIPSTVMSIYEDKPQPQITV